MEYIGSSLGYEKREAEPVWYMGRSECGAVDNLHESIQTLSPKPDDRSLVSCCRKVGMYLGSTPMGIFGINVWRGQPYGNT